MIIATARSGRRRPLLVGLALVATLVVGGCGTSASSTPTPAASTSAAAPATPTSAMSTPATPTASDSCVADPGAVVARQSAEPPTGELPADLESKLDAAAQTSFGQAAAPGAVVGVQTPQGRWTKAYGKADPKTGRAMTVDVHTRIGSVTKTYTGTVLMRLAQDGKLSLDDPIEKYVTGVPNGSKITLRQLADMTSGVASYTLDTSFTDVYFAKPQTVFTPQQLLKVGIAGSPLFEPGAQFNYSNTNTILLGLVIEKVTGGTVNEAFQRYIFDPLKLTRTTWPGTSTDLPTPYAEGFTLQGDAATPDAPANATHWNVAWAWTAGELISTMDDLLVYGRALGTGGGLLDQASQTERLTSIPGKGGYGIGFGCADGWVGHTGELPGYNTTVYYDTTSDTTVVVEVNSDIKSGTCEESPVLTDDPRDQVCSSPATRIFVALSTALGNTIHPPGSR